MSIIGIRKGPCGTLCILPEKDEKHHRTKFSEAPSSHFDKEYEQHTGAIQRLVQEQHMTSVKNGSQILHAWSLSKKTLIDPSLRS
jgi:hypothetical protein